jgi:broad specificity phosphatase PhoE
VSTRLLLTRHGETTANAARQFSGQTDVALTALGRRQARALGRRLGWERIDAAYASDLSRARETATIALQGHEVKLCCDARLRELSFGDWEGHTFDEVRSRWPDEYLQLLTVGDGFQAPGGERYAEARERALAAVTAIVAAHPDQAVLVVAHGGILQLILMHALGMSSTGMYRLATGNCGLSAVEFHGERPLVTLVNDCAHLTSRRRSETVAP